MREQKNNWSDQHQEQLLIELHKIYQFDGDIDINQYIKQIKVLEQYSLNKNRIFALFNHPNFYFVYLSKNWETVTGYTPEEIYDKGISFGFKIFYWKHLPLALKVHQWGKRFQKAVNKQIAVVGNEAFYCGVKMKDNWRNWLTFSVKQKILTAKNGQPMLSFLEIEEISSIYKADFVWGRHIAKNEHLTVCRAFFQNGKKKEYSDILSPREMEILHLAIDKKDNTAISEILGISKNTVERHRKNMIARLGVTDMTALIRICRLCQVL